MIKEKFYFFTFDTPERHYDVVLIKNSEVSISESSRATIMENFSFKSSYLDFSKKKKFWNNSAR